MVQFCKIPKTNEELLDQLIGRGLIVSDRDRALRYLKSIGYYRLGGYKIPFEKDDAHNFNPGTEFDDILNLYIFDRKLRLLVLDAVERIEVAFKAAIFDSFSLKYGPFWYASHELFSCPIAFSKFIGDISQKVESNKESQPYKHFKSDYDGMMFLPSWVITDLVTFSTMSRVYNSIIDTNLKKKIARGFDLPESVFGSWMHFISFVRNICAHHSMLWNKNFTITPSFVSRLRGVMSNRNKKFYTAAVVMQDLMSTLSNKSSWSFRLHSLLIDDCFVDYCYFMGFPGNWYEDAFWNFNNPNSQSSPR